MENLPILKNNSPGRDNILALLAATGVTIGILTALSTPITGFMITALTVISTTILSITGIRQAMFTGQKTPNRVTDFQARLAFWAAITLLAFTPVIFPVITIALGIAVLGYLLIWIAENQGEELTENQLLKITYLLLLAGLFFTLYLIPEILVLAIAFPAAMFVWRLIPVTTRQKILG